MDPETLFGLPAHPLLVHGAVVLLPLAALATIITAALPRSRRHYALLALAVALAATVAVALAQESGEPLEERVDETELVEEHTGQGERVLPWAGAVAVVAAGVAGADAMRRRYPNLSATRVTAVLVVAAVVTGGGATWSVIEVGHSGAKATWSDVSKTAEGD